MTAGASTTRVKSNKPTDAPAAGCAYQPTSRECALLLLHLIHAKESEAQKDVTRARLSESTLRRLWLRGRLTAEFIGEVEEWLFRAGWTLFFARSIYAVIRTDAVDGWMRIATKRISGDLIEVSRGRYNFGQLETLLAGSESSEQDDE